MMNAFTIKLCAFTAAGLLLSCQTAVKQEDPSAPNKNQVELGNQYARDGLLREAVSSYRAALDKLPQDATARRNLGLVLVKIGDYKNAIKELEEAIRLFESDFDTNFYLGEAYRGMERYAEAIYQYQRCLKIRPTEIKALKALSWSYFNIRFYSESLAVARKIYQLAPRDVQAAVIVCRTLLKLRRPKDALKILKNAKENSSKQDAPFLLAVEGNIRLELGQLDRAAQAFQESLKAEPLLPSALLGMGRFHLSRNEEKKAASFLERAVRAKPKLKEAYYYLGQAYEKIDMKKSIRSYQTFSKLAATDPEYLDLANSVKDRTASLVESLQNAANHNQVPDPNKRPPLNN